MSSGSASSVVLFFCCDFTNFFSHKMLAKWVQALWTNFSVLCTSYCIQLLSSLSRSSFSGRMGCDIVFALLASLSHSVFIRHYPNKRTTYHFATEFISTVVSTTSRVQFASAITLCIFAGKLRHVMDVYVVFHVQF